MRRQFLLLVGVCAALMLTTAGSVATSAAGAGTGQNYIVLYKTDKVPSNAVKKIEKAGGTVVYSYDQIGVVIANSSSSSFGASLGKDVAVETAAGTARFATQLDDSTADADPGDLPNPPATDGDSLSGLQWDMTQIHAQDAHAITGGSPTVLVGDIDSGLDYTHPDLAANVDDAASADCVGGVPTQGKVAAMDDNGHGTHTAATIAAAANGIGIVGVAPNVKIAGIKTSDANGFFYPEAVVCAFMWAGTHGMDVTNNSYFADPYLFNCKNDPVQRAIWKAEQRAIEFAQHNGVLVVAAEGNFAEDISHPTRDKTSPDDTTPVDRKINKDCIVIPVQIHGVVGVTATGNDLQTDDDDDPNDYLKSFYSSYGNDAADLTAPGGDTLFGRTAAAANGRVLSAWPASLFTVTCAPARQLVDASGATYCYQQGTSMASPHVTGVAALIISRYGEDDGSGNATMKPEKVAEMLKHTADEQPCPTVLPAGYSAIVGTNDEKVQVCKGGRNDNSWYGHGQVNALSAVTNDH